MAKRSTWKPRFIDWRNGKPVFKPGPRERALGFSAKALRHGKRGPWFTMEECRTWGEAKLAEITAAREGRDAVQVVEKSETVLHLLEAYCRSPDFGRRAVKTQADQRRLKMHILFEKPGKDRMGKPLPLRRTLFSQAPASFIEPADVKGFFDHLERERGLAMARAIIMLLSAAFAWGRLSPAWRLGTNPCHKLDLPTPPPRVCVWSEGAVLAMVAAAKAEGREEIADCIYLGLFTAQRLADRLELVDQGLIDGARVFRQNKTGVVVTIPEAPQLAARLAAAKERRRAMEHKAIAATIVVDEARGLAFSPRHYNSVFNQVKDRAMADAAKAGNTALVEELRVIRDQDLRDTAVTWLAIADCTLMQIASITGHSLGSIQTTIRHYLSMDPRLAGAAIGKLKSWMKKEGMKL